MSIYLSSLKVLNIATRGLSRVPPTIRSRVRSPAQNLKTRVAGANQLQPVPPPATEDPVAAWTAVTDPATGGTYWWNTVTNETTHVGAPKPTTATLAQTNQIRKFSSSIFF